MSDSRSSISSDSRSSISSDSKFNISFPKKSANTQFVNYVSDIPGLTLLDADKLCFAQQIGDGRSATIYRGTYDGRSVAIKAPLTKCSIEVLKEAKCMASLDPSPYLVKLVGYVANMFPPCLVMELMDKSLFNHTESMNNFDWDSCIQIAFEICQGIHDLHKQGYVHADIKPDNVLRKDHTNKLSDFGYTRNEKRTERLTGSPYWMAPEVARRNKPSKKSDIYSFGMLLLEITLGNDPADDKSFDKCIMNILPKEYFLNLINDYAYIQGKHDQAISELKSRKCPEILITLIQQCLQKKLEKRPTAAQIIETLKPFLKSTRTADSSATKPTALTVPLASVARHLSWKIPAAATQAPSLDLQHKSARSTY